MGVGLTSKQYGDQLTRVTLRKEAWIAHLSTVTGIIDLHDAVVPIERALATPERIAAIYFVSDGQAPTSSIPRASASVREYVLRADRTRGRARGDAAGRRERSLGRDGEADVVARWWRGRSPRYVFADAAEEASFRDRLRAAIPDPAT